MFRPRLVRAAAVAVVVGMLSFGSARATQAWGDHQAQDAANAARIQLDLMLARAQRLGVPWGALVPYRNAEARITGASAPAAPILWGSTASFYDRQEQQYRRLMAPLAGTVRHATQTARRFALAALATLQREITKAASLDFATQALSATLTSQRAAVRSAGTPRDYDAISARAGRGVSAALAQINPRLQEVHALVNAAGGLASGVIQRADAEAGQLQVEAGLLNALTNGRDASAAQLSALQAMADKQTDPFAAAIKAADIHALAATIDATFKRLVPSKLIVVSTENQWAYMYENGAQVYDTAVTTGGPELPTDHGVFHIYLKETPFTFHSPWPPGSPYYYPPSPVTFWMPFNGGDGLHDAPWRSNYGPGSNLAPTDLGTGYYILGTHGCVNLPYDAAQWVWNWAPVGTMVVVI